MKSMLATSVALAAAAAAIPASVVARPLTTVPGQVYVLKTIVDDKGVHIPKDKYTKNGVTRYPRGALIRYEFVNKGTKTYSVRMWFFKTVAMKPRGQSSQLVNWNYRGEFHYSRLSGGRQIKPVGTVVVF
jgi:hypothetical protein